MFSSNTSQVSSGGYEIQRSLRFNKDDSAYLNRNAATITNRNVWTYSGWIKRTNLSDFQYSLFGATYDANSYDEFRFTTADKFRFFVVGGGAIALDLITTQVFRDSSAWYHIVVSVDTTQATASNRVKLYVNGVQVTAFDTATYPAQNYGPVINFSPQTIGLSPSGFRLNAYMTEVNFIDGQALTPSSFGAFDAQTGVWGPTRYAGSYGTNGFYLNFSDNSNTTAATLGKDYSGNGNNWTPNNFSVSAGAGNDSLVDVPTNWGTDTGVGGSVRGNYATWNPLVHRWLVNTATFSNGNLDTANTNGSNDYVYGTTSVASGKWYWEVTVTAIGSSSASFSVGVDSGSTQFSTFGDWVAYVGDGTRYAGSASPASYGATYTTGDVIGVALDKDAGTVTFYKNNTSQGAITLPTTVPMVALCSPGVTSGSANINFGQRPFAYTAPLGFKALNTQNLPTPTIGATTATQANKYFDVVLRNGGAPSGGTYSTTVNMANGALLWDKPRNSASSNYLVDSVRGISKNLRSNTTDEESTDVAWFTGFNNGSFTTGSSDWGSSTTVVDWIWAANGAGVTNTAGSITSTVSANTTSGFSVVTYTGNATSGATVGHGLGIAPSMVICKTRTGSTAGGWITFHSAVGPTQALFINATSGALPSTSYWNNTSPTASVFSLGTNGNGNGNGRTLVAYVFAEVPGYSRFGSYTGNGSADGPFVFCGFRPAYVLVKCSSASENWHVLDNKRNTANSETQVLFPNLSNAEVTGASGLFADFTANGFKIRENGSAFNTNGATYIFAAFAEAPQKFALAR